MEWLPVAIVVALLLVWLVSLADAVRRPAAAFRAAGRSKALWVVTLTGFGWVASLVYQVCVLPSLRRAARELEGSPEGAVAPRGPSGRAPLRRQDWGDPFADGSG